MSKNHINLDYIHKSDIKQQENCIYSSGDNYIEKPKIIVNHFKSPENTS
jgi:hypothetical protein